MDPNTKLLNLLEKNKIIQISNDTFRVHPSFGDLLNSNLSKYLEAKALVLTIKSYCYTSSELEQNIIASGFHCLIKNILEYKEWCDKISQQIAPYGKEDAPGMLEKYLDHLDEESKLVWETLVINHRRHQHCDLSWQMQEITGIRK